MTVKESTSEAQRLKELVHRTAPSVIREELAEYLRCLKEGVYVTYTLSLGKFNVPYSVLPWKRSTTIGNLNFMKLFPS